MRTAAEQARQAARDEAAQREHLHKTRFLRKRRFDDGGLGGTFKLEPGVAVELYALLDAECERQFRIARAEGRREGHDAYAADALVELAGRGDATPPARPAVEVIARVDLNALYRGHPMVGELCEIAGVGAVPVDVIRDLLGEALLTLVLHDGIDVMNVTCAGRRGSKELRAAVLERAGRVCDGCGTPYGLELDHADLLLAVWADHLREPPARVSGVPR